MQRMKISEESYFKYVRTINEAFGILKKNIEPDYYKENDCLYDNRESAHIQGVLISFPKKDERILLINVGFSFTPRNRVFLSVGMCSSQNKQYKAEMEDTMRFIDCFGRMKTMGNLTLRCNINRSTTFFLNPSTH